MFKILKTIGFTNIAMSTTLPYLMANDCELICVRKGLWNYRFIRYDYQLDSRFHKPRTSQVLKYNYIPNISRIWINELVDADIVLYLKGILKFTINQKNKENIL